MLRIPIPRILPALITVLIPTLLTPPAHTVPILTARIHQAHILPTLTVRRRARKSRFGILTV